MPAKVIDTSALAALLFGEPGAEEVANRIQGVTLVCPQLLPFELGSVCLKKIQQHPEQRSSLLEAHAFLDRMEIAEGKVDVNEIVLLAEDKRLTVYDASYLWLARKLGVELITLDKKLTNAVRSGS